MENINKLRKFYHLKNIERQCSVGKEKKVRQNIHGVA